MSNRYDFGGMVITETCYNFCLIKTEGIMKHPYHNIPAKKQDK